MRPRVFVRCPACAHATVAREGAACASCGAAVARADAPADLFSGWRCGCVACVTTPC